MIDSGASLEPLKSDSYCNSLSHIYRNSNEISGTLHKTYNTHIVKQFAAVQPHTFPPSFLNAKYIQWLSLLMTVEKMKKLVTGQMHIQEDKWKKTPRWSY